MEEPHPYLDDETSEILPQPILPEQPFSQAEHSDEIVELKAKPMHVPTELLRGIANLEPVLESHPMTTTPEKPKPPEVDKPLEAVYERRHETKDFDTPVTQGATPVGQVLQNVQHDRRPADLADATVAASKGYKTLARQILQSDDYKQAIVWGFAAGTVVLLLMALIAAVG